MVSINGTRELLFQKLDRQYSINSIQKKDGKTIVNLKYSELEPESKSLFRVCLNIICCSCLTEPKNIKLTLNELTDYNTLQHAYLQQKSNNETEPLIRSNSQ